MTTAASTPVVAPVPENLPPGSQVFHGRICRFTRQVSSIMNSLGFQGLLATGGPTKTIVTITSANVDSSIIIAAGTHPFTGNQSMGGNQITNLADPTSAQDAATQAYVLAHAGAVTSVFGRTGTVVALSGDYTVSEVTGAAPLASPTFTGVPAAPTASLGTNTTQVATTAFVLANSGGAGNLLWPTLTPPVDSQFSWINQLTGATTTQNSGAPLGVNMYCPAENGGSTIVGRLWGTTPSTPFHIQSFFQVGFLQNNYAYGLFFTDTAGKFIIFLAQQVDSPPVMSLSAYKFSNSTTAVAAYSPVGVSFLSALWLRIGDDGTNLTFDSAPDGVNWWNLLTVSRTDYLNGGTYQVGWFIYPANVVTYPSFPLSVTLLHWLQTT